MPETNQIRLFFGYTANLQNISHSLSLVRMDAIELPVRLSRNAFRALAKAKGWKFTMLAARWGVTPEWISEVSRNPQRDVRYDDALYGLPDLHHLKRDLQQRAREVEAAVAGRQERQQARARVAVPGYRYRGYLVSGAVVTVAIEFGSIADEGQRGIVFMVEQQVKQEIYGVVFERGGYDWFSPDAVDRYLVATGLIASGAAAYRYRSAALLQADFENGVFNFWPELAQP